MRGRKSRAFVFFSRCFADKDRPENGGSIERRETSEQSPLRTWKNVHSFAERRVARELSKHPNGVLFRRIILRSYLLRRFILDSRVVLVLLEFIVFISSSRKY